MLIVSGGHTELILMRGHGQYERLGATLDDAAGEAFDKVARLIGLGYPGGPAVQAAAEGGDPAAFRLPARAHQLRDPAGTSLQLQLQRPEDGRAAPGARAGRREPLPVADLAASFQAAVVDVLVSKTAYAAATLGVKRVCVCGGVAANKALREAVLQRLPVPASIPPFFLCTDNAAMIGAAAHYRLLSDGPSSSTSTSSRTWRWRCHKMPHALETERLVLRPFIEADIDVAYRLFEEDPEVYRFDPGYARTLEQRGAIVRRHIAQNQENGEGTLAVTLKTTGELIGQAGLQLYVLPWQPFATPEVELYYKFGRPYWGQGYALEACRALVDFAFNDMRLLRLVTITQPQNLRSVHLLQRLGFCIGPAPDVRQPAVLGILTNPAVGKRS